SWLESGYLSGNELRVAPILVGNSKERDISLPRGGWYDYWTNRRFEGGRSVTWSGARTQLPLFVREGAIIPLISPDVQTLVDAAYTGSTLLVMMTTALDFTVYPAGWSQFTLYDGARVSCQATPRSIGLALVSTARPVRFRILQDHRPASVILNGLVLPERANLDGVSLGWAQTGGFTVVKFPHPGGTSRVFLQVQTN